MLTMETDVMPLEPKEKPTNGESGADAALKRVIDIIVHEFNGDTVAYFESVRPNESAKNEEIEKRAACIAQKFAKRNLRI
jgi:hypothetical protein